jgi:hypothetical protein
MARIRSVNANYDVYILFNRPSRIGAEQSRHRDRRIARLQYRFVVSANQIPLAVQAIFTNGCKLPAEHAPVPGGPRRARPRSRELCVPFCLRA